MKGVSEPIELFEIGDDPARFNPPEGNDKVYRVVRSGDRWLPVVCSRRPARGRSMTKIHKLSGIVDVGGLQYEWELRSEPHWSESEGWKGMTVALLRRHTQRGALLEFPPPKRLLKGLQRGRLQVSDAVVIRGIQAALDAGWEPASRGKPMVFMVDADGNVIAALSLVTSVQRMAVIDRSKLTPLIQRAAREISARLH